MLNYCSNCGYKLDGNEIFCTNCGFKIIEHDISSQNNDNYKNNQNVKQESESKNNASDNIIDFDNRVSSKMGGLFGRSKLMGKFYDTMGGIQYKNINKPLQKSSRRYFNKIEPVFLEVYDSIDDSLVKSILLYARSRMSGTNSVIGTALAQTYTPTKDLPHNEAIKYYQNMADNIAAEINNEKEKGQFDEEEFYKRKVKEISVGNISFLGISTGVKEFEKNR